MSTSVMPTAAPANRDGRGDVSSAGPRRLAERLKLRPPRPEDDPVTNLLRQHDADELRLLAELQRRTGRPARTEVVELMRQRREGATVEQLRPQVERLFADDLATRMVVLRWLSRNETTGDSP